MKIFSRGTLGAGLAFIIIFFLGRAAYREWDNISEYNWSPHFFWLFLSLSTLFVIYFMAAYGWILTLRMIGGAIDGIKGVSIFLLSMFGRYIPGGIWTVLGRVYLSRLEGIPDSRSSMSILLEQAYPIVSAGLVFAVSLIFWHDMGSLMRVFPLLLFFPLMLVFLHPKPFLRVMNPILSRFGKGPIHIVLSFNNMLKLTGYYAGYWMVSGIAFYFFIRAFYPLGLDYIPILSGIYAISFTAGYLAFFTPAGLGVREGTLTILLSLFMPTPVAIGVALLSRLWLIGVELIILLVFLVNTESRRMVKTALGW